MSLFSNTFHFISGFISALFMLHENWKAPESLFALLHVVITCTSLVVCACLVSPGIAFLPGLDSNHLEPRPLWQTAKRRQLELPALACAGESNCRHRGGRVFAHVCLLAGGLLKKKKPLGLISTTSGPMKRSKLREKLRLSQCRCVTFWQSCFSFPHRCISQFLAGYCYLVSH